jgi:hypothetical protein
MAASVEERGLTVDTFDDREMSGPHDLDDGVSCMKSKVQVDGRAEEVDTVNASGSTTASAGSAADVWPRPDARGW